MKYRRLRILLFAFAALAVFSYSCNLANSPGAYELVTSVSPEQGGTIDPAEGKFKADARAEVTANPADGYRFVEWEGDLSGSENPTTLTFDSDKNVRAVFEIILTHELNITIQGEGTVAEEVLDAKGDFEEGTVVQITAVPEEGWVFVGWEGDLDGNENPATITMDSEKNVTAVFESTTISLDIVVEGEGTVQEEIADGDQDEIFAKITSDKINLGSANAPNNVSPNENEQRVQLKNSFKAEAFTDYERGAIVRLTAQAAEDWMFLRWEGDLEGAENPANITMDGRKEITAVFMEVDEEAEIIISTNNVTEITQNSAVSGGNITIVGDASVSLRGVCWSTSPNPDVDDNCTDNGDGGGEFRSSVTGLNPQTNYYVRAYANSSEGIFYGNEENFTTEAEPVNLFTISISTQGAGSVMRNPDQTEYEDGENVVLTAAPDQGWQFSRWEGDLQGSQNPSTISMNENKSVTAIFEEQVVENEVSVSTHSVSSITFNSAVSGGNINADGGINITQRGVCWDVNENPDIGDNCSEDGSGTGTFTSSLTELSPTTTYHVRAYAITTDAIEYGSQQSFTTEEAPEMFTVDVQTEGEGAVELEPNQGEYMDGSEITLTATPNEGWEFANWEGDLTGTENPATVTVDENLEITAVFEAIPNEFTINITEEGEGSVSLAPNQATFTEGETVTLTATAAEGWEFANWEGDLTGAENPATVMVDENLEITAVFEEIIIEVNLNMSTDGNGTVELDPAGGIYTAGEEVTLSATANEGFQFTNWSGDMESTNNPETVIVNEDMQIMANFEAVVNETSIEVSATGEGTVNLDPDQDFYQVGQSVTFTATPAEGWQFQEWQGDINAETNPITVNVVENMSVTAIFEEIEISGTAMNVSHGFNPNVTPGNIHQSEAQRSYPVVQANWSGPGGDKRWLGRNLGATVAPTSINDDHADRAGWYFQFNRSQGYYEDDITHESVPGFPVSDVGVPLNPVFDSDWINNDPCNILFGGNWRVPTREEWSAAADANAGDVIGLHHSGSVSHNLGALFGLGEVGAFWVSTQHEASPPNAYAVHFENGEINEIPTDMDSGLTVRCIEA